MEERVHKKKTDSWLESDSKSEIYYLQSLQSAECDL